MSNNHIENDLNWFQKIMVYFDLAIAIVIYGCGINDYFQYNFYKRRHSDRKNFIVHRKRMWLVNNFNDKKDREKFNHKPTFNRVFNDYLKRQWLDTTACSLEEFKDFVNKAGSFFIKLPEGSHGIGSRVYQNGQEQDLEGLFRKLKAEKVLVEELIEQNEELKAFNPTSVNTIRVVTLLINGSVNIMTGNLRTGNGKDRYADNFHHQGIAALLDVKTGLVISKGVDKNLNYYSYHPLSGKQIIGFNIPVWSRILDVVKELALVVPTVGYVGWDIAIGREGEILLVEGNAAADPDISQIPDQFGKWPLYRNLIFGMKS